MHMIIKWEFSTHRVLRGRFINIYTVVRIDGTFVLNSASMLENFSQKLRDDCSIVSSHLPLCPFNKFQTFDSSFIRRSEVTLAGLSEHLGRLADVPHMRVK